MLAKQSPRSSPYHIFRVTLQVALSVLTGDDHYVAREPADAILFSKLTLQFSSLNYGLICGFGGLEVACWPLVTKFAGSHPAEAVGFIGRKKSSARLSSEGK